MRPQLTVYRWTLARDPFKAFSTETSAIINSPILDYNHIRPIFTQPARLYATGKSHKFEDHNQIITDNLKLWPIISTGGTYFYETAKALSKCLAPLAENQHTINNTLGFAENLQHRRIV